MKKDIRRARKNIIIIIYVTGFAKTDRIVTTVEIQFIV